MIKVVLRNNSNNKEFVKEFDSQYIADNFIRKCRHGNKLTVLAIVKEA